MNNESKVCRNMKQPEHAEFEKTTLRKRSVIDRVFDELKNLCQTEDSRHRSVPNFIVNLRSVLMAYCMMEMKPRVPVAFTVVTTV